MNWEQAAKLCEDVYGIFVDYNEGFFICPYCDEPIYADDFRDGDFEKCPVCEEYFYVGCNE